MIDQLHDIEVKLNFMDSERDARRDNNVSRSSQCQPAESKQVEVSVASCQTEAVHTDGTEMDKLLEFIDVGEEN